MNKRSWIGLLVAPLVAPFLFQIGLILFEYESIPDIYTLITKAFFPLLIIALPVSYGAILFIGMPLVWFLNRINLLNFISLTSFATIFGSLIMAYIYGPQAWTNIREEGYLWYLLCGGFIGFSVAAVYSLITGITVHTNRERQSASHFSSAPLT